MSLSKLVFLVWVLFVSAVVKGWSLTHTWLPAWAFWLGIAFVVLVVLEFLGIVTYKLPKRTARVAAPTAE